MKYGTLVGRKLARKVPAITLYFWVIKLLTTALGESLSDFLINHFNPYIVVILGFLSFLGALLLQYMQRRYIASIYWVAVLMVAVFGTMAADIIHVVLGLPYAVSAILFIIALTIIFVLWAKTEKTLSVHSITTHRREAFYWAAVLATFALGTALGDFVAYSVHLGFLSAALIFALIFALPALGYWLWRWNAIFVFWFAYIMTRPLGASFADWTGKAHAMGGLGWGNVAVITGLGLLFIVLVGYVAVTNVDVDAIERD